MVVARLFISLQEKHSGMSEVENQLKAIFHQLKDGRLVEDEVMRLLMAAQSYALCENSIAVFSNMLTGQSHIFRGATSEMLGFGNVGVSRVDSVWEDEIFERLHPDDWKMRCLQELSFYRMVSLMHSDDAYNWHMENVMRVRDASGKYRNVKHRIFYFSSSGKAGVCYAICLYNLTSEIYGAAYVVNSLTGERRLLDVDNKKILSDREKDVLKMIGDGMSSKMIADALQISKHTVDRHRQNIIAKLQAGNSAEAFSKAKELDLI